MMRPVPIDIADIADLEPLALRAADADPGSFIRLRTGEGVISAFVTLPYDVLAGRTIAAPVHGADFDVTFGTQELAAWMAQVPAGQIARTSAELAGSEDGEGTASAGAVAGRQPPRRDAHWLSALPPRSGWKRIQKVPDSAIREVVRSGQTLARGITAKRQQDSLLSSTVLSATANDDSLAPQSVEVPLRAFTALTKMGFLPRDSEAAVDLAPGWMRVAAQYGSTFVALRSSLFTLSNT